MPHWSQSDAGKGGGGRGKAAQHRSQNSLIHGKEGERKKKRRRRRRRGSEGVRETALRGICAEFEGHLQVTLLFGHWQLNCEGGGGRGEISSFQVGGQELPPFVPAPSTSSCV